MPGVRGLSQEARTQRANHDPNLRSSGLLGRHYPDGLGSRVGVRVSAECGANKRSSNLNLNLDRHRGVYANSYIYGDVNSYRHSCSHFYTHIHTDSYPYAHTNLNAYTDDHPHSHIHSYPNFYLTPNANPDYLHRETWRYPLLDSGHVWHYRRGHCGGQRHTSLGDPKHRATIDHPLSWAYGRGNPRNANYPCGRNHHVRGSAWG